MYAVNGKFQQNSAWCILTVLYEVVLHCVITVVPKNRRNRVIVDVD